MPHWMWFLIAVMVVVAAAVLVVLLRRRGASALTAGTLDFARVHQLARAVESRLVEHMQAAWSGRSEDLPQALRGALEIARRTAHEQLVPLDETGLRLVVTTTVCGHKLASRAEVARALASLDAGGRSAA